MLFKTITYTSFSFSIDFDYIFKGDLSNNLTWEFDFSEISKRRFGRSYIEQTSYEPHGRNMDFFNPVKLDSGGLVIFEDYGPGVFTRLLWQHSMNFEKNMDNITIEVGIFFNQNGSTGIYKAHVCFFETFQVLQLLLHSSLLHINRHLVTTLLKTGMNNILLPTLLINDHCSTVPADL